MNAVHHICLGFLLWPCGKRKASQQWFIGAKAPNELCRGKTKLHSQQVLLPTTASRAYSKAGILDEFLPSLRYTIIQLS
ncbi:hypothetical protein SRA_04576 [Streptococcus ratti FA-1 = DSM 20564]|uniref:Secreted protein n=1 Tax=Streptococcus ratti FA-1 = DSM 20564 TaxID=699248 RepID=A0ABN0GVH0_STRRT|nr:hypothetical protein SRA_04576 [Streptococcus ratti FA-1 = DSM 20564]